MTIGAGAARGLHHFGGKPDGVGFSDGLCGKCYEIAAAGRLKNCDCH